MEFWWILEVSKRHWSNYITRHWRLHTIDCFLKTDAQMVVLVANIAGKASVAVGVSDELMAKGLEAPKLIKEHITPIIKGGGGGSKNLATAGGQDASNLDNVIEIIKRLL